MLALTMLILQAPTTLVLGGLDPISLAAGNEQKGNPEITASYLRHEYRFATEENRRQFLKNPTKHGVNAGGACGKMGALTGKGSPSRFAVVRGQIYLFASDSCRETFLRNEASYFATARPTPKFTEDSAREGKSRLANVIVAHGGAAALKEIKSFNWVIETPYKESGTAKTWIERWGWMGPGTAFSSNEFDAGANWFALNRKRTSEGDANGSYAMHPEEVRELDFQILRNPLGLLVRAKEITPYASGGGFVAVHKGGWLAIGLDKLARISSLSFYGRHAGPFAQVTYNFSDHQRVGSVTVPMTIDTLVNGKAGNPRRIARWEINGPTPRAWDLAWTKS